ncbi:MAG: carboxypeptidase-like regulatory domain-containing protein [Kofleriaceae bacterium]
MRRQERDPAWAPNRVGLSAIGPAYRERHRRRKRRRFPDPEQERELDDLVAARCADANYVAWVNDLPDANFACLLRATTMVEGDACMAALQKSRVPADANRPGCPDFQGTTTGTATIAGVVRTSTGEPFAGATVVVSGPSGDQTIMTDELGAYSLSGLTPGNYHATEFVLSETVEQRCISAPGAVTTNVDLKL